MNNKGLTIVELVVSFVLAVVVSIFLLEIILILRDAYVSIGARSTLISKQSAVSDHFNKLFDDRVVIDGTTCGENCIELTFDDNRKETIHIDTKSNTISIGDYANKFPDTVVFGDIKMHTSHIGGVKKENNNSILNISIPIKDKVVKNQNFNINVIYQYDNRENNWSLLDKNVLLDNILLKVPNENDVIVFENGQLINLGEYGIRYQGSNPDNYIYFNCSDYLTQNNETCEVWRIIGVVDGKVKIIRNESLERMLWDDNSNNWNNSTLKSYLNSEYLTSLNGIVRNMILPSTWYLRGHNTPKVTKDVMYNLERTTGTIYGDNPSYIENTKIGLMYPSDWAYAAMETSTCLATTLLYNYDSCKSTNWIIPGKESTCEWTITAYSEAPNAIFRLLYNGTGAYNIGFTDLQQVRPTLYLSDDIEIIGEGTSLNPYQIIPK